MQGFQQLETYFDGSFGTLSAIQCESTFHVRRYNPGNTEELLQMTKFIQKESNPTPPLGYNEVHHHDAKRMTLVAVDMNIEGSPLGHIASYLTVELFSNEMGKNFLYIGNSYTPKQYQRLGLSVLLRFFLIKLVLELKDVLHFEGLGSYTMVPESRNLMVNKLGFHKWDPSLGTSSLLFQVIQKIQEDYGEYVDTFLMLENEEDVQKLKNVTESNLKLMGACMLNFQKYRQAPEVQGKFLHAHGGENGSFTTSKRKKTQTGKNTKRIRTTCKVCSQITQFIDAKLNIPFCDLACQDKYYNALIM